MLNNDRINSQSIEDVLAGYTLKKLTLNNTILEKYTLEIEL